MKAVSHPFDLQFPQHPCDDPVVRFSPKQQSYGVLFDCGDLRHLTQGQIFHTPYICISHTHVDHFIGFDLIIRHSIKRGSPLFLFGPEGFASQVSHRLLGYIWNLLVPDQMIFFVTELAKDGRVKKYRLVNQDKFFPELIEERLPQGNAPVGDLDLLPGGIQLQGVVLDHDIDVVAYRLNMPTRYNVNKERLIELGLEPGPWINDLKESMAQGNETELAKEILSEPVDSSFGYITDIAFHKENLRRALLLLKGITVLACETSFLAKDENRARERLHLTTRDAAEIASLAGAAELVPFHVSRIYKDQPNLVVAEALGAFQERVRT